jgi:hypothetical protein
MQDDGYHDEALKQSKSIGAELRDQLSMGDCFASAPIRQTSHMLLVILFIYFLINNFPSLAIGQTHSTLAMQTCFPGY